MAEKFMGVQLGSHSIYDEGIDHCLDILQETAGINAVFVYATTYQGFAKQREPGALAPDHGVEIKDPRKRDLTRVWFEPHEQYYKGTILRHDAARAQGEFHDRDVFEELREPLDKRGMKLYARILEGFAPELPELIPNWTKILSVDCYGRPTRLPCFNNPEYVRWWISTVEDLFKSYRLDGFKYGSERSGPLSNLLFSAHHKVSQPLCFCEHCQRRGREKGIDVERARRGFTELHQYVRALQEGAERPPDGVLVTLLRFFMRYPEILAWEYLWWESKEDLKRLMYGAIKAINPEVQVGWHVYHQGTTWDPVYRAETDYGQMAEYSDWIKPVVYHDIAGPRIWRRYVQSMDQGIFQELTPAGFVDSLFRIMGYDAGQEPQADELTGRGLSADSVYTLTKRCVDGVAGRAEVYAGVGFDIPWKDKHFPSDSELVYQATKKAFEAGASGLVVSREYDEMRLDNLRAVGRALKEAR